MRLDTEFVKLPLRFDGDRLAAEVEAVPEAEWRPHPQGHPGNSALPLLAAGGDPANDATRGVMAPTPQLARLPYLRQVLAALSAPIGRTRLMRLDGNAEATAHADVNYYWTERLRVHVPVVTTPSVRFLCGEPEVHMKAGECWVFDTWRIHNVLNPEPTRRIHLVADTVGSAQFADLVAAGAHPFTNPPRPGAPERFVPYRPGVELPLPMERRNHPAVMSPWEQASLAGRLLADAAAGDATAADREGFARALETLGRNWRALWALHGDGGAGLPEYEQALEDFERDLRRLGKIRLPNRLDAVETARHWLVRPALDREALAAGPRPEALAAPPAAAVATTAPATRPLQELAVAPPAARPRASRPGPPRRFDRPVFLVCPPRSGSSLLFETLAQSPAAWTVGGESHRVIEVVPALQPARRGWGSNRLTAEDARPEVVERLVDGWFLPLRDRDGRRPAAGAEELRLLEKTPKNALRVPFLAAAFPDARFVYLYRNPREAIHSIWEAWGSGRFVTYPDLPGWTGPPWSLLLVPGWRELIGRELPEIAARQWAITTEVLVGDLEALAPERWCVANYGRLVSEPQLEVERLCRFLDLPWDRDLSAPLPASRHTLTPPGPGKWRRQASLLGPVFPLAATAAERALELFARRPDHLPLPWTEDPLDAGEEPAGVTSPETATAAAMPSARSAEAITHTGVAAAADLERRPARPEPLAGPATAGAADEAALTVPADPPEQQVPTSPTASRGSTRPSTLPHAPAGNPLRSVASTSFPALLKEIGSSLLVSTYQSGRVVVVRADGDSLNTHFRTFASPMGLALGPRFLAIGTARQVWEYRNVPAAAQRLEPAGRHDACFLPRACHVTGDVRGHEMAFAGDELWLVNTRFSCLASLDGEHSFVPRWRPPFVTALAPEDRCHLNGLAVRDGEVRYVTALGTTDTPQGWRERKAAGGVLLEVPSGEAVATGLSMPHSPRWHGGRLWVLESGKGELGVVDPASGRVGTVAQLPGFTRGLAFAGPYAFVGLSQVRESVFGGLPLGERLRERTCGVCAVDVRSGAVVALLRFEDAVQEIFEVALLPGMRFPELSEADGELVGSTWVVPPAALEEVPQPAPSR
jgi:uncharacterized protein (TIGR03032 family)